MNTPMTSYSTLSDDALAAMSRQGDDGAFHELVLRYFGRISFIARKYSAHGYEHTDFVQEGLLGLLYAVRTYRADASGSFGGYALLVAERRFISIIRRQTARRSVPESALVAIDAMDDAVADVSQTPEEALLMRDRLQQVYRRLEQCLSKREFSVLTLYADGLSYSEIASRLGISVKSVDNALQRARKKISSFDMS